MRMSTQQVALPDLLSVAYALAWPVCEACDVQA